MLLIKQGVNEAVEVCKLLIVW